MTTLIEIFDRSPIENIVGTLAIHPDMVIFIGPNVRRMLRVMPTYEAILRGRGIQTELICRSAAKNDPEQTVEVLDALLDEHSDEEDETCIVDISGGDESLLLSIGLILVEHAGEKRELLAFRCEPRTRQAAFYRVGRNEDGKFAIERDFRDYSDSSPEPLYLTVEEMVALHGGSILTHGQRLERGDPIGADVDALWEISRRDCAYWNTAIGRFSAEISRHSAQKDVWAIAKSSFGTEKNKLDRAFFDELAERGLIEVQAEEQDVILFTYKNKIVRECLTKAGSILEYYTYKTALELESDGKSVFDSAETGVVLDWDGAPNGTKNEVDVILTRGLVPVFISCKNGDIAMDELYKVSTVTEQFGGELARRVLLSTVYLDPESSGFAGQSAAKTMEERARDMRIRTLSGVHRMGAEELGAALHGLVK